MIFTAVNLYTKNEDVITIPATNFLRMPQCCFNKEDKGVFDVFSLDFIVTDQLQVNWKRINTNQSKEFVKRLLVGDITGIEIESSKLRAYGICPWEGEKKNSLQWVSPLNDKPNCYKLRISKIK